MTRVGPVPENTVKCVVWDIDNTLLTGIYLESPDEPPGADPVLAAVLAYNVHHYRVARVIELERVRTRIATDLHDDIGAGLSRIAVLSEIANHQVRQGDWQVTEPLATIAGASRARPSCAGSSSCTRR